MNELFRRLGYLFNRNRRRRELEAEMAFHREMTIRAGRPEDRRRFGNSTRLHEQSREAWGWIWLDRFIQDLRYATRMLARSPGFTISAVLVLAIGIGSCIFAFSAFNWIFLQSLPLRDPDSLVQLQRRALNTDSNLMPYPTAIFYRDHAKTLSTVMTKMGARLELETDAQPVRANFVSANYFKELGASAAYGRLLDPSRDDAPNAPPVVIIGYEFWQRRFGADPSVVGRTIHLNRKQVTIIGIEPVDFPGLGDTGQFADVWLPISKQPRFVEGSKLLTDISNGTVSVSARLAPNVTAKMAEQELLALTNELRKQFPDDIWKGEYIHSDPGGHLNVLTEQAYRGLAIVGTLILLILAVACANLGGLLLARGVAREHEVAIRIAIGASRQRIFRQLFTESLLLALLGSAAGLGLAYIALRIFITYIPNSGWMSATPDWRVSLFALGMALLTSILFGFTPALQMARQQQKKTTARQLLIGAQVAASCILLINSSLLVRAAQHLVYTDPGFGYEQVLAIDPGLGQHGYLPAKAQAFLDQFQSRLRAMPGIASVSLVKYPPLGDGIWSVETNVSGHPLRIFRNWVDPEFFRTMEIPLLLGRNFLPGEKNAIIVSESLAHRQWPGENPLGKIYWDKAIVVGVAGSAMTNSLNEEDTAIIYAPAQLGDMPDMRIVLKSNGAPDGLIPMLKSTGQSLDPKLFPEISLLKSTFRETIRSDEIFTALMSLIGIVAMALAAIGILGLVAYAVSQRTKEIAIHIALGAPSIRVLRSILRPFFLPVLLGATVGMAGAAALAKIQRGMIQGISNLDPISYAAAIAILLGTFAIAALLPARRALKLDIARALHQD
jgi:predicted permease